MDQVRHLIVVGQLKKDDQLPTVRQLATELRVNFNTVARAYRLLDEAGLISTQQGRGTYILDQPSQDTREKMRLEALQTLTERYIKQTNRLGFSRQAILEEIDRQHSNFNAPESSHSQSDVWEIGAEDF